MKETFTGLGKLYYETEDKAIFKAIKERYPEMPYQEMLVLWMTCKTSHDFYGFAEYNEIVPRLENARSDRFTETLRKEFLVDDGDDYDDHIGGPNSLLFSSDLEVKQAISHAGIHNYIRYEVKEFAIGGYEPIH